MNANSRRGRNNNKSVVPQVPVSPEAIQVVTQSMDEWCRTLGIVFKDAGENLKAVSPDEMVQLIAYVKEGSENHRDAQLKQSFENQEQTIASLNGDLQGVQAENNRLNQELATSQNNLQAAQAALQLAQNNVGGAAIPNPDAAIDRIIHEQTQIVNQLDYIPQEARNRILQLFETLRNLPECTICHQRGHLPGYCGWNGQMYNTAYNAGPEFLAAQTVYRAHIQKEQQKVRDQKKEEVRKLTRDYALDSKAKAVAFSKGLLRQ